MRNIPTITKNLLIINVIAYLAMEVLKMMTVQSGTPIDLNDIFGLHFFMASDFHVYQIVTYMFMHGGMIHLFFNMFALWMFGCVVENVLGARNFLFYYILCGIGAGLFQEVAQFVQYAVEGYAAYEGVTLSTGNITMHAFLNSWTTVGASGAVYAILLAFGMIFPEQRIFIFPLPIPIKAKWFVIFYAALELYSSFATTNDGVAHIAHLGGMVFGFFLLRYWKKSPDISYGNSNKSFFEKMRNNFSRSRSTSQNNSYTKSANNADWDYNARKHTEQDEIDAILDKIRKSGYDNLSNEEKQKLFDQSHNRRP